MLSKQEEILSYFTGVVALKLKVRPPPQAELMASKQLVRDIQNGEIDKAAGLEFLIQQEMKYGQSREAALAHFEKLLAGQSGDWPGRSSGLRKFGDGSFAGYNPKPFLQ